MIFSSLTFMCLFLPGCLVLYYLLPKLRNMILIVFSLAFYAFGEPVYILLLLFSVTVNWLFGLMLGRRVGTPRAKAVLIPAVAVNLLMLAVFKYAAFAVQNINAALGLQLAVPAIALPLGISFYTFQALSYVIDVYRGQVASQRSFWKVLLYVSMFPQLVAGPIVRYSDIAEQIDDRRLSAAAMSDGVTRFAVGLGKKVLLANAAGRAVSVLLAGGAKATVLGSWQGIAFYAFQLYFDFSGYSDMAIGLGKMLGFDFPENFNYPYISRSITEFWRRWHITLSSFFRDYVYIPLGGNRKHHIPNLLIVWMLTGLWHGAGWNFILWGAYYGVLLIIEKYVLKNVMEKWPSFVRHAYSVVLILIGWMFFYFTDLSQLTSFLKGAVGLGAGLSDFRAESGLLSNLFLLAVLVIASTPLPARLARKIRERRVLGAIGEPLWNVLLLAACFIAVVGSTYNPFLYFRF